MCELKSCIPSSVAYQTSIIVLHFLGHQWLGKNKENTKSETNARRSASFSFNAPHLDWVLLQALSFTHLKKNSRKWCLSHGAYWARWLLLSLQEIFLQEWKCKILQQLFNKLVINNYFQAQTMTLFFETRYKIWVWFVVCHAYSGWCPSRHLSWGRGIVRHQIHKGREWIKSNMESVLGLWFKSGRYSSNGSLVPCDLWRNQQSSEEVKKEEGGSVLHRDINSKSIVQLHVTRNL